MEEFITSKVFNCDRCEDNGWIKNTPPWPLLGPLSIECPKCLGGRNKNICDQKQED